VSELSFNSHSTHHRSFWSRAFPGMLILEKNLHL